MANYLLNKKSNFSSDVANKYQTAAKGMTSAINSEASSNENGQGSFPGSAPEIPPIPTTSTTTTTTTVA